MTFAEHSTSTARQNARTVDNLESRAFMLLSIPRYSLQMPAVSHGKICFSVSRTRWWLRQMDSSVGWLRDFHF